MKTLCFLVLLVIVLGILAVRDVQAQAEVTLPHGGSLVGTVMNTVRGRKVNAFLGIPYAEPPVGSLRFKPPTPAGTWTGTKSAKTPPPACPQVDIYSADRVPFGNEDCLYVNVYAPQGGTTKNLPVMVWIHGGAYHMGSSDPVLYGPERILDNDVILATFNYRLGPLGFLSTGTLDAPGNYGLKDQRLLLQWTKENIKAFGGNPEDITIFGWSAGSASVSLHMVSEKSEGLFHKAILQSGNLFDPWAMVDHPTSIERLKKLGDLVGCPLENENFEGIVTCLREVPATELVKTIESFFIDGIYPPITVFGPVVEPDAPDAFLPEDPRNILDSYGNTIPIIIGRNADEGVAISAPILNQHDAHFRENFDRVLPKLLDYDHKPEPIKSRITERIDNFYFRGTHDWSKRNHYRLSNMFTDRLSSLGMDQFLRNRFSAMHRPIPKTYVYIFDHRGPTSFTQLVGGGPDFYGVSHGDELPFLFPQGQLNIPGTKADQIMRWAMPKMWTDFASKENPTPHGTSIREYWKSTKDFPLRYVTIGNKYSSEYSDNSLDFLYEGYNFTSADFLPYRRENSYTKPRHSEANFDDNKSNESRGSVTDENSSGSSEENTNNKRYNILKNRKGLYENRVKFWRSLERLLY